MTTNEKSQYFRLRELTISGYKNINNLDVSFKDQDGITVLIGNNGCGKSNIIEALSSIFAGLYNEKLHTPQFSFRIQYELLYHTIDIVYDKQEYVITVDDYQISKASLEKDKDIYLPKNIIACYSGEYLRLFDLFFKPYYDNYITIVKKEEKLPSLPLLYINKYNLEIAVLTLFFYDFSVFSDISSFCHDTLNIKNIKNITFSFNKDKKVLSWKENEVIRMVKLLCNSDSIKVGDKETLSYDVFKRRLSSYEGNERELFQHLYGATMSKKDKIITDISIEVELNTGSVININDLSEGEKKYILMKVILETLADENSLLLFDEPDAHIHISRKAELGDIFEKYKNRENVITTHSPTMAVSFSSHLIGLGTDKGQVVKIDHDKEKIVSRITEKMWNVHEQNAFLSSNKPMTLLVEGKTDKIHIEEAYKHLSGDFPFLDFDIFSMNSSEHIREVLIGLSCSEIKWDKQFVGIFDNDQAGQKDIGSGFEKEKSEERIKHVKYKDGMPSTSFYAFLLPKPSGYTDKDFTIENCYDASKYEEAFSTALEDKKGYFVGLSIDTIADELKNKSKIILANKAKSFAASDFEGFRPIFELLDKIRVLRK